MMKLQKIGVKYGAFLAKFVEPNFTSTPCIIISLFNLKSLTAEAVFQEYK